MEDVLKAVNDSMQAIGLNYEFMEWTKPPDYPYWVGEYSENEATTEDGFCDGTLILTGFTRGKWLDLEQNKKKIEQRFDAINGRATTTDIGSVVVIFYGGSLPIRTGDAELKKIQVNLIFKKWKVE